MRLDPVPMTLDAVGELVARAQEFYRERYGSPDATQIDVAEFAPPKGLFLLGTEDGTAVACGGWRSGVHGEPGDAELKRMFVVPEARGKGYARRLLAELERTAAEAGNTRLILETGTKQPEAIALYLSSGYRRIEAFGYYREEPESRCYAKELSQTNGDLRTR